MTLLSKKDFAVKCGGMMTKHLSTYISRSKVIVRKDDLIDDQNEFNYAFLIKHGYSEAKAKVKPKLSAKKKPVVKKPVAKPKKVSPTPKPDSIDPEVLNQQREMAQLDKQEKIAKLEKTEGEAELKKLAIEKQRGLLIPTRLAISVIQLQAEGVKTSFHEACENLIIIIGQKKKLTNQDIADIRKKLTNIINTAIDSGVNESKKGIQKIVEAYSEVRGVGERKQA